MAFAPDFSETEFFYHLSADQVLLNDALQHFGRGGVIPDAFGIDHRNRAAFADAQAVGFGAVDAVEQSQFGQPALEVVPGLDAAFLRAALGLGLLGAQEDMPLNRRNTQSGGDCVRCSLSGMTN